MGYIYAYMWVGVAVLRAPSSCGNLRSFFLVPVVSVGVESLLCVMLFLMDVLTHICNLPLVADSFCPRTRNSYTELNRATGFLSCCRG
jgi:hypothetical protein